MKKFAVFVEGLTEQEFVINLIKRHAGSKKLKVEIRSQHRGHLQLEGIYPNSGLAEWHVLIVNCNNDEQVKTQIIDNYGSLIAHGYQYIIGVKDVFPFKPHEVSRVRAAISKGLPTGQVPIDMHLAVMEVEAWFIEEYTHFSRIHPSIDESVVRSFGFDRAVMKAEEIEHPADLLHRIYQSSGLAYKKSKRHIARTINALDLDVIFGAARQRAPSLDGFLQSVEKATA